TFINNFAFPDLVTDFLGGGGEVVFDNSITTGVNQYEGTRMKAGIMHMSGLNNPEDSFGKIYVDARHYQKVHKQIVWANRLSYGHYFGNSPKPFLIGGADNWINAREEDGDPVIVNSAADLFYLQYVTNLRGFLYNARSGSKFLLHNSELRIPIIQYLTRQPIGSGFFRNLQLTAFSDIGTAYTGSNPFSRNNSYNRQVIGEENSPFRAVVFNYRNPFLFGYGFGARTTLLGMYGKLDVAWGEEDNRKTGPRFYITLGYDF
ncbi:MAG: hypothetical protein LPK19_10165, partial [Hymenobacteraceae bacterium]|nr:hypothetical protein [Hymenobacteraceae bacterium]MDX5396588.1 hypothetical protein [Hymenobacteraceae bacterium]MDX5512651.1 hypothetical protein [Hymenobacteraceae bacterium]